LHHSAMYIVLRKEICHDIYTIVVVDLVAS